MGDTRLINHTINTFRTLRDAFPSHSLATIEPSTIAMSYKIVLAAYKFGMKRMLKTQYDLPYRSTCV